MNVPLVKPLLGVLYGEEHVLEWLRGRISSQAWSIQRESATLPFDLTDYYRAEMGLDLKRLFLTVRGLRQQTEMVEWKLQMRKWEDLLRVEGMRTINLDPGFLDYHRVVLLSFKEGAQKIYLHSGVWADLVLLKKRGGYRTFPWTFPDLREDRYHKFFLESRRDYKLEMRENGGPGKC